MSLVPASCRWDKNEFHRHSPRRDEVYPPQPARRSFLHRRLTQHLYAIAPEVRDRGVKVGDVKADAMQPLWPLARQSSAIEVSPRRPSSTMRIFSSAAWCFRVARRMLRTSVSDDAGVELDFCLVSQQRAGRVMMPAAVTSGRPFLSWSLRP